MKKLKDIKFYLDGVDAELNLFETITAIVIGISIVAIPLLIKVIMLAIGF